jgi:hypothetical protein
MRSSQSLLAVTIIAGLFVAVACAPATDPVQVVTPTASPSIGTTPSNPSSAPTPTAPSPPASPTAARSAPPSATPNPTPVPVPLKPTGVTFDQQVRMSDDGDVATVTQAVRWRAPRNDGVEIRVFGVTACIALPASPPPGASGPCLVVRTPLPASRRTLLATAPASDGVVSWTWKQGGGDCEEPFYDPDGPAYHAVVLAAYGPSGHSVFAIAEPGGWWEPAPGDTIC